MKRASNTLLGELHSPNYIGIKTFVKRFFLLSHMK